MMLCNVPICLNFLWQGLTATGLKRDQIFVGDINTLYKSGKTTVDVKVDTYSNVSEEILSFKQIFVVSCNVYSVIHTHGTVFKKLGMPHDLHL